MPPSAINRTISYRWFRTVPVCSIRASPRMSGITVLGHWKRRNRSFVSIGILLAGSVVEKSDDLRQSVRVVEQLRCRGWAFDIRETDQVEKFMCNDIPLKVRIGSKKRRADAHPRIGIRFRRRGERNALRPGNATASIPLVNNV